MTQIKCLIAGLLMLVLSACAAPGEDTGQVPLGPIGQRVADAVIDVSNENRGLRVCWLAAGAVEVMTNLAFEEGDVWEALGHLVLLQGAIDKAHSIDPLWIETDTADVALLFAAVLKDVGKSRLSQILLGGPTLSNFLNVAKRTVILTVKGSAVMRDINRVLQGVEDGIIQKVDAWKACEDRTAINRNALYVLTGGHTLSSMIGGGHGNVSGDAGSVLGTQTAEKAFLGPGGTDFISDDAISPEQWLSNGGTGALFVDGGEHDISLEKSYYTKERTGLRRILSGVAPNVGGEHDVDEKRVPREKQMVELDFIYPDGCVGTHTHSTETFLAGVAPFVGGEFDHSTETMLYGDAGDVISGDAIGMQSEIGPMDGDIYPDGWVTFGHWEERSGIDWGRPIG